MPALDRKWWTLVAVCTATFMLLLDITVVNVALPSIQRSLDASFSDLQWVVDAYSLSLAVFLLTAGVLGDIRGRREVFAIGLAIFTVSSLVCGLSTSPLMLNIARAVQGVGGAVMFATSVALIASAFQGRERGTAFGIYGAVLGGAVAVGPLVGGALTTGVGWRWIFFVNVPIGVAAVGLTLAKVQESRDPTGHRVDWIGVATFSVSLFTLVLALIRGNSDGWGSALIVTLLVVSAVSMALFIAAEGRVAYPMLDLSLFRRPAMTGVSIAGFCLAASIFALFLYITFYIQDGLGYGPFAAGVRFLPITVMSFLVAPIAGRLTVRVQSRFPMGIGLLLVAAGLLWMATTSPGSGWTQLLPGFLVAGRGHRDGQPGHGLVVGGGGARRTQRDGLRDQLHVPPDRHRHRNCRSGCGVRQPDPAPHHHRAELDGRRAAGAASGRLATGGGHAVRQRARGRGHGARARPDRAAPRLPDRLLAHLQRADGHRSHRGLRGRRAHPGAGPPAGLRSQPGRRRRGRKPGALSQPAGEGRARAVPRVRRCQSRRTASQPSSHRPAPARVRGRPRDERVTRAITEAALRQLLDEGYARLSMESVASEAGVSRATIYRRFKDKADLVTAAIAGSDRLEAATADRAARVDRTTPAPISSASCSTSTTASTARASRSSGACSPTGRTPPRWPCTALGSSSPDGPMPGPFSNKPATPATSTQTPISTWPWTC